ncbi:Clavaminate synthase-like protein [Lactifluus volemus]|nr:Clavaminate synthase-like protein [Lactifluus volemus]
MSAMLLASVRTDSTFDDIPVIDLKGASSTDPAVKREIADQIRDASINVGFFYIKGHGISDSVLSGALAAAQSIKMELDIHKSKNFKGYTALLGENTNPENRGDLHEGFDMGWEELGTGATRFPEEDGSMAGENIWPKEAHLPDFRRTVLEYYHEVLRLGQYLFPLFALALDLPEDFFADKTTKPAAIMRLLYYPPQMGIVDDRTIGIGAHTEYTRQCFTILWQQDDINALQVLNTAGKWVNAVPIPGSLVINLGDQFARWTNDVFRSTVHRAVNRSGVARYSIPLFFGTDYNVLLEALPSCVSDDFPAKYEVVVAGDYVKSRLEASYGV